MGNNEPRRSRKPLIIMAVLFLLPAAAASIVYKFFPDLVTRMGMSNHGTLVRPVRPIETQGLVTLEGKPLNADIFRGKWTYIYIDSSDCDRLCRFQLYLGRQVRLAQGKDISRLQRLFVVTDRKNIDSLLPALRKNHPHLIVATLNAQNAGRFLRQFSVNDKPVKDARRTYIIDPVGQLMMYYEPEKVLEPAKEKRGKEMLMDMRKLMHNSKVN